MYPGGTRRSDNWPPNPEVGSGDGRWKKKRCAERRRRLSVQRGNAATGEHEEVNVDPKGVCSVKRNLPLQSSDEVKGEPEKTRESNFPDGVELTLEKDTITCHVPSMGVLATIILLY
ncbi:hypothetical protein NDU88_004724 [Pleurodeles waltl]|uniref:Uncharacterized protein n=1 Tax=Pleurodeles waltl TaxID=8319 RepID=A0AAV7WSU4_PLEWA|nr:hypothetical protein NDU88_004724 [Pleurodeles waltl]